MNYSKRFGFTAAIWLASLGTLGSGCVALHGNETALGIDDGASDGMEVHGRVDGASGLTLSLKTGAALVLQPQSIDKPISVGLERTPDEQALVYIRRLPEAEAVAGAPHALSPLGTLLTRAGTLRLPVAREHADKRLGVAMLNDAQDREWKLIGTAKIVGQTAEIRVTRLSLVMLVDLDLVKLPSADETPWAEPDAGTGIAVPDGGHDAGADLDHSCGPKVSCDGDAEVAFPESAPGSISGTLVNLLAVDPSGFVALPHELELIHAETGAALGPDYVTQSAKGTGQYIFRNVPLNVPVAIHVKGVGPASDATSTYDSVIYYAPSAGDSLARVSSVGTAAVSELTGAFTAKQERAPLAGAVYQVDATGKRIAAIGCAQVFLNDGAHPALDADQRYVTATGLPTTLGKLEKTLRSSGKFYFGNLVKGKHTLKVSIDGGKSFIAEKTIYVPIARAEASSEFKAIQYFVGIDITGLNPTPAGCTDP